MNESPLDVLESLLSVPVDPASVFVSEVDGLDVLESLLLVPVDPASVFVSEVDALDDEGLPLLSILAM